MLTIVREMMSLGSRLPSLCYLLHYHYDRWLFKTITGAINSAKQAQCSPATAGEHWRLATSTGQISIVIS